MTPNTRRAARGSTSVNHVPSVLDQARKEGYDKGRQDEKEHQAQISMCKWDDVHEEGRQEALAERPSRLTWFMIGVLTTVMFSFLMYSFAQ